MNVIHWFTDSALTNSAGTSNVGYFNSVEMSSAGSYDVRTLRDSEDNEVAKVYIFKFSEVHANLDSTYTPMPIGAPEENTDFEHATLRSLYTQGKTRVDYKYFVSANGIAEFYLMYPYAYTDHYIAVPYEEGGLYYNWISVASWDTATFTLDGVSFFSNLFNYRVFNEDVTEEIIVPLCIIHPNTAPETKIFAGISNGYSYSIITGYNVEHYTPMGNNTRLGGTGNGNYNGASPETIDIAARNAAFAITSTNGDGLTYYYIDSTTLNQIVSYVYGSHIFHDSDKILNAVVSAHILPILYVPTTANIGRVFLANVTRSVNTAHIITSRLVTGSMGSVDLTNSGYDDFNDFENTTASIYLPFVGRITLDINAIARGIVKVDYIIDLFNGNIGYWIYTQSKDAVYPVLYGTYTGNCAVEIPLCGSGRTGNTLGKILNAGSQIAAGFAESPAKGAIDIYNAAQSFSDRTVNKSGANDVNSGCLIPYQCRLDIERREVIRTEDYADLNGVPAFDTVKLSEISGFVKVQTIDLSGITCEQSERDELRRLLEKGVYI